MIPSFESACENMAVEEMARTVHSWVGMFQRCYSPAATGYANYGGRGITVVPGWQIFANFVGDMGTRPEGKTLDRIDYNGNYEPENCRWATRLQQARNTRRNRKIVVGGQEMLLVDASRKFGIEESTLFRRLGRGMTPDEACDNAECVRVKLCENDVHEIRRKILCGWTDRELSAAFQVSVQTINHVRHRQTWSHI